MPTLDKFVETAPQLASRQHDQSWDIRSRGFGGGWTTYCTVVKLCDQAITYSVYLSADDLLTAGNAGVGAYIVISGSVNYVQTSESSYVT